MRIFLCSLLLISGIVYPQKRFYFGQEGRCPFDAYRRLEEGDLYNQELFFLPERAGNNFKYDISLTLFTKQMYKKLFIRELGFISDEKKIVHMKNKSFKLPEKIYSVEEDESDMIGPHWLTNDKYYWTAYIYMCLMNKKWIIPRYNFEKLFKDKEVGDRFKFKINCIYTFDDEEERNEEYVFSVKCEEGEYVSPFMFW